MAARSGRTLTSLIEDALREALARRPRASDERTALRTFAGDGLQPGIDLDDTAALLQAMEERA